MKYAWNIDPTFHDVDFPILVRYSRHSNDLGKNNFFIEMKHCANLEEAYQWILEVEGY
jgi:hypothetical protein